MARGDAAAHPSKPLMRVAPALFLTLVLLTGVGLLAPTGADARFTDRDARSSVRVAWHFWHSLRPHRFDAKGYYCGKYEVKIDWRRRLGSSMALADIGGCRERPPTILLEGPTIRRLSDVGACGIVTHEFGHLLGYEHVRNPAQLMSGDPGPGIHPPGAATWKRAWHWCRRAL